MPWVILVLAGLCEVAWAVGLKRYGLTATWGGAATIALMLLSFLLLGRAMRQIPLGTAYGVWTGIGAVGAAAYGMWRLGEPADWRRVLCITLIVAGIVGLKLFAPAGEQ
jgi:quaternary ammonium compound-resistance protein SugE